MPRLLGLSLILWSFVFALMCASSGPKPIAGDAGLMCAAASSFFRDRSFAVTPMRGDVSPGRDGKFFVKYPLLTVVQCMPALALRDWAARKAPDDAPLSLVAAQLVPHAVVATLALGSFYLALQLGLSAAGSAAFALIVVLTTPIWLAARSLYSEALQAMLVIWFTLFALRARDAQKRGAWAVLGVILGLAINAKIILAVLGVGLFIDQLYERWDRQRMLAACFALPGLLLGAAAFVWYNYVRFGDPWTQGYGVQRDGQLGFSVPMLSGVYGLLFSSGKSVFQYAPVLLAAAWAVPRWYRERRRDLWLIAIPCVVTLCVIGKWWAWSGDWGWGPRLLLPVVPLACVPIVRWIGGQRRAPRVWLTGLAAVGLYVQLLGLSVDPSQYLHIVRIPSKIAMAKHWDAPEVRDALVLAHFVPEFNPIVSQQWLLMRYFDPKPFDDDSWYPWRSLGVRDWRPKNVPNPERLNFWITGDASRKDWLFELLFALTTLALAAALIRQLKRATKSERLRARTAQALTPAKTNQANPL
jgi:hypothetical protein